jgi:hypothetical protein
MKLINTTVDHIDVVVENISEEDFNEYVAYKKYIIGNEDMQLHDHLVLALSQYQLLTLIHGDIVIGIGGDINGNSWFLVTKELATLSKEEKKEFITTMNQHKEKVLDESGLIWNYVWEGNKTHINFLTRLDAVFPPNIPNVPEQFKYFEIRRN